MRGLKMVGIDRTRTGLGSWVSKWENGAVGQCPQGSRLSHQAVSGEEHLWPDQRWNAILPKAEIGSPRTPLVGQERVET